MSTVLPFLALALVAAPVRAEETYYATVDGNQLSPPVITSCVGHGTFTLSADETQLAYEIHFTNWVNDEFAAHIHEQDALPGTNNHILDDIALGPDKIGFIKLSVDDVVALRESRLFVLVHTTRYPLGHVKGWIVPSVGALPTTWGAIRSLYR